MASATASAWIYCFEARRALVSRTPRFYGGSVPGGSVAERVLSRAETTLLQLTEHMSSLFSGTVTVTTVPSLMAPLSVVVVVSVVSVVDAH